jgi:CheY-like chemotaxis protein
VLEVSLRKAGFTVTPAASVQDALDKLELNAPDLIISETTFPDGDGFELRRRVRATQDWADIPFIFLTAEAAIENKIRGLELGVDDYLTKPIYIKEIVTRINILLQKRQRVRFEERKDGRTRFAGRVADMPVVDVIQTIEISRKSGVIQFVGERGRQAAIYFRDGRVIDAEAGTLQAEDAVYRLLTWSEGEFEVVFRTVRRREVIGTSSQGLLMEGMRRLDEWSRLLEQLPVLTHRFEIDTGELAGRLGDVPDDNNQILRLFDGKRTLLEVIDGSDFGDLECLQAISRLYFEGMLIDLDHGETPKRDTGRPMPLTEVSDSAPTSMPMQMARVSGEVEAVSAGTSTASARVSEELGVGESQVIEEITAPTETPVTQAEEPPPASMTRTSAHELTEHQLMGNYRPSGLLRIDEAIAAAQAIDPMLFDDGAVAAQANDSEKKDTQRDMVAPDVMPILDSPSGGNAVPSAMDATDSVPQEISPESEMDGMPGRRIAPSGNRRVPQEKLPPVSRPIRSEESGLRMISSQNLDRAEASGELVPLGASRPTKLEPDGQREMVTIMPRRITREMAVVQPPTDTPPQPAPPVEPPAPPVVSRVFTPTGSGVVSREPQGPSTGAKVLISLAAVLVAAAMFVWLRGDGAGKTPHDAGAVAVVEDAAVLSSTDAGAGAEMSADAATVARVDASVVDAAVAVIVDAATITDAAVVAVADASVSPAADAGEDPLIRARALQEQATAALDDADYEKALDLADQSLRLRRTARAYIARAQALQRLHRVDEAIASMDEAIKAAPTFAGNYDTLGSIYWAAGRYDEAKAQYEEFLKLQPTGDRAKRIKQLLSEQP